MRGTAGDAAVVVEAIPSLILNKMLFNGEGVTYKQHLRPLGLGKCEGEAGEEEGDGR